MPRSRPRSIAPFGTVDAVADYRVFVATLQARQLETPTARVGARAVATKAAPVRTAPLADILAGRPGWQDAVIALGGSFNPAQAARQAG